MAEAKTPKVKKGPTGAQKYLLADIDGIKKIFKDDVIYRIVYDLIQGIDFTLHDKTIDLSDRNAVHKYFSKQQSYLNEVSKKKKTESKEAKKFVEMLAAMAAGLGDKASEASKAKWKQAFENDKKVREEFLIVEKIRTILLEIRDDLITFYGTEPEDFKPKIITRDIKLQKLERALEIINKIGVYTEVKKVKKYLETNVNAIIEKSEVGDALSLNIPSITVSRNTSKFLFTRFYSSDLEELKRQINILLIDHVLYSLSDIMYPDPKIAKIKCKALSLYLKHQKANGPVTLSYLFKTAKEKNYSSGSKEILEACINTIKSIDTKINNIAKMDVSHGSLKFQTARDITSLLNALAKKINLGQSVINYINEYAKAHLRGFICETCGEEFKKGRNFCNNPECGARICRKCGKVLEKYAITCGKCGAMPLRCGKCNAFLTGDICDECGWKISG